MKYNVSEKTASLLDLLREFEALTDKTAAAISNLWLEEQADRINETALFPAAAAFRKVIEDQLILQIEDNLPLEGKTAEI